MELDNCEHLFEKVADLVDLVLKYTKAVKIIETSREPLEVWGEMIC